MEFRDQVIRKIVSLWSVILSEKRIQPWKNSNLRHGCNPDILGRSKSVFHQAVQMRMFTSLYEWLIVFKLSTAV